MPHVSMNLRAYWRALAYAHRVCPPAESATRLAHLVFVEDKVVCADGTRWHVGILPAKIARPIAVAKDSVAELLLGLEYADKIGRRHGGNTFVHQDGVDVEIHYAEKKIVHRLQDVKVGPIPAKWKEPVPPNAPQLNEMPEIHAGHIKDAVSWYRSWEKDHGQVRIRGLGGNTPVRYEIVVDKEVVVFAILMPVAHAAAQLPLDEPLFAGGVESGQSILDLSLELPPPAQKVTLKVGQTEIDATGLANPEELIKVGPCSHRDDTEPCATCTKAVVKAAQKEQSSKVVALDPTVRRRGKGKGNGNGNGKDAAPPAPKKKGGKEQPEPTIT